MTMFVIIDTNSYDEWELVGICSSKAKANIAIELLERYDYTHQGGEFSVREIEVDEILNEYDKELEKDEANLSNVIALHAAVLSFRNES